MSFSQNATLPVVRQKRAKSARKIFNPAKIHYRIHPAYPVILIGLVVLTVTLYLCQSANHIRVQYELGQMKDKKATLLKEQRELKLSIENLESLERIEKIAREDMKMVQPPQRLILNLQQPASTALSEDVSIAVAVP